MIRNRLFPLFTGIVLIGCSRSIPDGWTTASWRDYAGNYPKCAKAAEFIQSSPKRRQQRDIYLNSLTDKPTFIDGHAASVDISKNGMTGRESSSVKSWVHFFLSGISVEMEDASSKTFTENMVNRLEREIKKAESNLRGGKAYLDDLKEDPSRCNPEKLKEAETQVQDTEHEIQRYRDAIVKISQIGG